VISLFCMIRGIARDDVLGLIAFGAGVVAKEGQ
jgi:hypothetical protein